MTELRAVPKPTRKVVSRAVRDSARDRHCTLRLSRCRSGTGTVVLAHLRGKWAGVAQKPHDIHGVYACDLCHEDEEIGDFCTDSDRLRALIETQDIMIAEGLIQVKGDK